jgi:hypothetical protein
MEHINEAIKVIKEPLSFKVELLNNGPFFHPQFKQNLIVTIDHFHYKSSYINVVSTKLSSQFNHLKFRTLN